MNAEATVTRTYRTALRIGEDFITIEETITLPLGATDAQIAQAVELGMRIYQTQRNAVEDQVASIREATGAPPQITVRAPETPASDKQRSYIGMLQDSLGWTSAQLASHANEQGIDLVTITKGQASTLIEELKRLGNEPPTVGNPAQHAETRPARTGTFDYVHVRGRAVVPVANSVSAVANDDDDSDIPF